MLRFSRFENIKIMSCKTYTCSLPIISLDVLLDCDRTSLQTLETQSFRAPSDYIQTTPRNLVGDRMCANCQIDGNISPILVPSDYNIAGSPVVLGMTAALAGRSMFIGSNEYIFSGGCDSIMSIPTRLMLLPGQEKLVIDVISPVPLGGESTTATVLNCVKLDDNRFLLVKTEYIGQRIPKYNIYSISVQVSKIYCYTNSLGVPSVGNLTSNSGSISRTKNPELYDTLYSRYLSRTLDGLGDLASTMSSIQQNTTWVPTKRSHVVSFGCDSRFAGLDTVQKILNVISFRFLLAANSLPALLTYWPDLADSAIDNLKFEDINAIAYASDMRKFLREVLSVISVSRDPLDPKRWSKLWLGFRYGSRLTLSDTGELISAFDRYRSIDKAMASWAKPYRVVRSRSTVELASTKLHDGGVTKLNYKVYYRPSVNKFIKLYQSLYSWDILPTLQNSWDLIPLSFVVDWFVDVEGLCNDLDRSLYEMTMDIISTVYSAQTKFDLSVDLSSYGCVASNVKGRVYKRYTSRSVHQQEFRVLAGHLSNINIIDGAAILISKW